ncbi:MAG: hypothetical protein ACK5MR_02980, partial [Cumulibacter sp.]
MPEHPNDEQMAWAVLDLPDWANEVISWVAGGQSWPKGSETMLQELADHWQELSEVLQEASSEYVAAATTLSEGWEGPSFEQFYNFSEAAFFGQDAEVPVLATMAGQYSQQARAFATEVNYAKISINIAFYIAIIAAFISVMLSWLTGGGSLVIGAAVRQALVTAIRMVMQKLLTAAGRKFVQNVVKKMVIKQATVAAARTAGQSAARQIATRVGREVVEEVAEEVFIDVTTQLIQMNQGNRTSYDVQRTVAAGVGGAVGGLVGAGLSFPLGRIPRPSNVVGQHMTNLAISAGTNMLASPTGSYIANGAVYGNWDLAAAFSPDALLGAAATAAGRYNTASPFSPDTMTNLRTAATSMAADITAPSPSTTAAPSVEPSNAGQPSVSTNPDGATQNGGQSQSSTQSSASSQGNSGTQSSAQTSGQASQAGAQGSTATDSGSATQYSSSTPAAQSVDTSSASDGGQQSGAVAAAPGGQAAPSGQSTPSSQSTQAGTGSGSHSSSQSSTQSGSQSSQTNSQSNATSSSNATESTSAETTSSQTTSPESASSETTSSTPASNAESTAATAEASDTAAANAAPDNAAGENSNAATEVAASANTDVTSEATSTVESNAVEEPSTSEHTSAEHTSISEQNSTEESATAADSSAETALRATDPDATPSDPAVANQSSEVDTQVDESAANEGGSYSSIAATPNEQSGTSTAEDNTAADRPNTQTDAVASPAAHSSTPGVTTTSDSTARADTQQSLRSRLGSMISPMIAFNVPVVPPAVRLAADSLQTADFDTHGINLTPTQISAAMSHTFSADSSVRRDGQHAVTAAQEAYARLIGGDPTQADVDLLTHQVAEVTVLQHLTSQAAADGPAPATRQEAAQQRDARKSAAARIADQVSPRQHTSDSRTDTQSASSPAERSASVTEEANPATPATSDIDSTAARDERAESVAESNSPRLTQIASGGTNQTTPAPPDRAQAELAERGRLMIAALTDDALRIAATLDGQQIPTADGPVPVTMRMIQDIKMHLFRDIITHSFNGREIQLPFAGDVNVAEAWLRLAIGDTSHLDTDLDLIAHEHAEIAAMREGMTQAQAHVLANEIAPWETHIPNTGHPLLTALDADHGVVTSGTYQSVPVRSADYALARIANAIVNEELPQLDEVLLDRSVRQRLATQIADIRALQDEAIANAETAQRQSERLTSAAAAETDPTRSAELRAAAQNAQEEAYAHRRTAQEHEGIATDLQIDLDGTVAARRADLNQALTTAGPPGVLELLGNPHLTPGSIDPRSGRGHNTHPNALASYRAPALRQIAADLGISLAGTRTKNDIISQITQHLSSLADPPPPGATPQQRADHEAAQQVLAAQAATALTDNAEFDAHHDDLHHAITNRLFEHLRLRFLETVADSDPRPESERGYGRLEFRWTELGGTPSSTEFEVEHTGLPIGITHPLGLGSAVANLDGMRGRTGLELKDGYAAMLEDGEFVGRHRRDLSRQFAREVAALRSHVEGEANQRADELARTMLDESGHTAATAPPELRRDILSARNAARAEFLAAHPPHVDVVASNPDARAAFASMVASDPRLAPFMTVLAPDEHRSLMRQEIEAAARARYPALAAEAVAIVEYHRELLGGTPGSGGREGTLPNNDPEPGPSRPPDRQLAEHGLTIDPDDGGTLTPAALRALVEDTPRRGASVLDRLTRALGMTITHTASDDSTVRLTVSSPTRSLTINLSTVDTSTDSVASIEDDIARTHISDPVRMQGRGAERAIEAVVDITLSTHLSTANVPIVIAQGIARASATLEPDAVNNSEDLLTDDPHQQVPSVISQVATDTDPSLSPRDIGRLAGLLLRFDDLEALKPRHRAAARAAVAAELTALGLDLTVNRDSDGNLDPDTVSQYFARLQGIPDLDGSSRLKDAVRSFNTNENGAIPDTPAPVRQFTVKALAAQAIPAAASVGAAMSLGSIDTVPILIATAAGGAVATALSVIADIRKFHSAADNTRTANDRNPRTADQDRQAGQLRKELHDVRSALAESESLAGAHADESTNSTQAQARLRALADAHARGQAEVDEHIARQRESSPGRDVDSLDKIASASTVRFKAMGGALARAMAFGVFPIADVLTDHNVIDVIQMSTTQSVAMSVASAGYLVAGAIGGGLLRKVGLSGDPGIDRTKAERENRVQAQKARARQVATDVAAKDAYEAQRTQIELLLRRAEQQEADAERIAEITALLQDDADNIELHTELAAIADRARAALPGTSVVAPTIDTARLEQALDKVLDVTAQIVSAPLFTRLNPFRRLRREIRLAIGEVDHAVADIATRYGEHIATSLDEISNGPDREEAIRLQQRLEERVQQKLAVLQSHPENGARLTAGLSDFASGRYFAAGISVFTSRIAATMMAAGGMSSSAIGAALFAGASATGLGWQGERSVEMTNELRKFHDRFARPDKWKSLVAVQEAAQPGMARDLVAGQVTDRNIEILARIADLDPVIAEQTAESERDVTSKPAASESTAGTVAPAATATSDPAVRRVASRLFYLGRFSTAPFVTAIADVLTGRSAVSALAAVASAIGIGPAERAGKIAEERAPAKVEKVRGALQKAEREAQDARQRAHRANPQLDRTPRQQVETLQTTLQGLSRNDMMVRGEAIRRAQRLHRWLDVIAATQATEADETVPEELRDLRAAVDAALGEGQPRTAIDAMNESESRRLNQTPERVAAYLRGEVAAARARIAHTDDATRVLDLPEEKVGSLTVNSIATLLTQESERADTIADDLAQLRTETAGLQPRLATYLASHPAARVEIENALTSLDAARNAAAAAERRLERAKTLSRRTNRLIEQPHPARIDDAVRTVHSVRGRTALSAEIDAASQNLAEVRDALEVANKAIPIADLAARSEQARDTARSIIADSTSVLEDARALSTRVGDGIDTTALVEIIARMDALNRGAANLASDAARAADSARAPQSTLPPISALVIVEDAATQLRAQRNDLDNALALLERHSAVAIAEFESHRATQRNALAQQEAHQANEHARAAFAAQQRLTTRALHSPSTHEHINALRTAADAATEAAAQAQQQALVVENTHTMLQRVAARIGAEHTNVDTERLSAIVERLDAAVAAVAEHTATAEQLASSATVHAAHANAIAALDAHAEHRTLTAVQLREIADARTRRGDSAPSALADQAIRDLQRSLGAELDERVTTLETLSALQRTDVAQLTYLTARLESADEPAAIDRLSEGIVARRAQIDSVMAEARERTSLLQMANSAGDAADAVLAAQRSVDAHTRDLTALDVRIDAALADIPADFVAYDAAGNPTRIPAERAHEMYLDGRRKIQSAQGLLSTSTTSLAGIHEQLRADLPAAATRIRTASSAADRAAALLSDVRDHLADAARVLAKDLNASPPDTRQGGTGRHRIVLTETPQALNADDQDAADSMPPAQQAARDVSRVAQDATRAAAESFAQFGPVGEVFNAAAVVPRGEASQIDAALAAAEDAAAAMTEAAQRAQDALDEASALERAATETAARIGNAPRGADTSVDLAHVLASARRAAELSAEFGYQTGLLDDAAARVTHHSALAVLSHTAETVAAAVTSANADLVRLREAIDHRSAALDQTLADESTPLPAADIAEAAGSLRSLQTDHARLVPLAQSLEQLAQTTRDAVAGLHVGTEARAASTLLTDAQAHLARATELSQRVTEGAREALESAGHFVAPAPAGIPAPDPAAQDAIRLAVDRATAKVNEIRLLLRTGDPQSQDAARSALQARLAANRAAERGAALTGDFMTTGSSTQPGAADVLARAVADAAHAETAAEEALRTARAETTASSVRTAYAAALEAAALSAVDEIANARRLAADPNVVMSAAHRDALLSTAASAEQLTAQIADQVRELEQLRFDANAEAAESAPQLSTLDAMATRSTALGTRISGAVTDLTAQSQRLGLLTEVVRAASAARHALDAAGTRPTVALADYVRESLPGVPVDNPDAADSVDGARQDLAAITDSENELAELSEALRAHEATLMSAADDLLADPSTRAHDFRGRLARAGEAVADLSAQLEVTAAQGPARAESAYGHLTQAAIQNLSPAARTLLTDLEGRGNDIEAQLADLQGLRQDADRHATSTDPRVIDATDHARTSLQALEAAHQRTIAEREEARRAFNTLDDLRHQPPRSVAQADSALSDAHAALTVLEHTRTQAQVRSEAVEHEIAQAQVQLAIAQTTVQLNDTAATLEALQDRLTATLQRASDLQAEIPEALSWRSEAPAVRAHTEATQTADVLRAARIAFTEATALLSTAPDLVAVDSQLAEQRIRAAEEQHDGAARLIEDAHVSLTTVADSVRHASFDIARALPESTVRTRGSDLPIATGRTLIEANAALNDSPEGQQLRLASDAASTLRSESAATLHAARAHLDTSSAQLQFNTRGLSRADRDSLASILADIDTSLRGMERSTRAFAATAARISRIGDPLGTAAVQLALPANQGEIDNAATAAERVLAEVATARSESDAHTAEATARSRALVQALERLTAHHRIGDDRRAHTETTQLVATLERLYAALPGGERTVHVEAANDHLAALRQAHQEISTAVARQDRRRGAILDGSDPQQAADALTEHDRVAQNVRVAHDSYREALARLRHHAHAGAAQQIADARTRADERRDRDAAAAAQAAESGRETLHQ